MSTLAKYYFCIMKKYECVICGYIHEGDEIPEKCPVCGATEESFVEITEE